eukprot:2120174-Pyramimonas_sp.AAC.1
MRGVSARGGRIACAKGYMSLQPRRRAHMVRSPMSSRYRGRVRERARCSPCTQAPRRRPMKM